MLASQLIYTGFPAVNLFDKVSFALQLMEDYDVLHLPVLSEDKFSGVVEKDDLLDVDQDGLLASLEESLKKVSVKGEEHFLVAVKLTAEHELTILPVINEHSELVGIIPAKSLFAHVSRFIGNEEKGGIIVLETDKRHFSFGEISRLVETNEAYITQLNTYPESDTGLIIVTIKINKIEVSDIVATFQRYDYAVRYYFGEEQYANELKENYNHLLAYLNM